VGWEEDPASPHLFPSPVIVCRQQQGWVYWAKCPLANSSRFGCHPPVQNNPSCKAAMETSDQMDFSWKKKKKHNSENFADQ